MLSVLILITVLVFLRESLTKQMRTENAAERKKSQARYHELKALMHVNPDYVPSIDDRYILELNQGSYLQLICKRDVLITCVMYGLYAVIQGGQDAIYPVWLINSPEHHGFDFTSSDLGWMYTGLSPMQIFATPLLFPLLTRLLDRKSVSFFTGYIYCFFLFLSPIAALANRSSVTVAPPPPPHAQVQWLVILFSYGLAQCFRFMFVTYPFLIALAPSPPPTAWSSSPTAPTRISAPRSTASARSCPPSAASSCASARSVTCRVPPWPPTSSRGR